MTTALVILIAVVAGVAVALQGQFMGSMNRVVGTIGSVFVTYGVGGVLAALLWFVRRESLEGMRRIPWYVWGSGALGLVIVAGIGYAAPRIGLSRTLVLTVTAQLVTAVLVDQFGLLGATPRSLDAPRLAGLALTITGAWLVVR